MYTSIEHFKNRTEEGTQLIPSSFFSHVNVVETMYLQVCTLRWDLQPCLSILCIRRYIEMQAFILILAHISLWNAIFTTVSIPHCVLALRVCLLDTVEEFGNLLLRHARCASIYISYIQLIKWILLLPNLKKNYNIYIAGIQENKWFHLSWHLAFVGDWKPAAILSTMLEALDLSEKIIKRKPILSVLLVSISLLST